MIQSFSISKRLSHKQEFYRCRQKLILPPRTLVATVTVYVHNYVKFSSNTAVGLVYNSQENTTFSQTLIRVSLGLASTSGAFGNFSGVSQGPYASSVPFSDIAKPDYYPTGADHPYNLRVSVTGHDLWYVTYDSEDATGWVNPGTVHHFGIYGLGCADFYLLNGAWDTNGAGNFGAISGDDLKLIGLDDDGNRDDEKVNYKYYYIDADDL